MIDMNKQKEPVVDFELAEQHGLNEEEWERILKLLGRVPTYTELGVFSVMWSEHCSYKNSIAMIKTLPRSGKRLLVSAGEENAGLVDIGDGLALVFKMESHNHPSAIEPFQGAATGVGRIIRDIFAMGARPIALLDSLRFGPLDIPRNRYLLNNVVKGIAHYGNCMGVPTVAGEIHFDKCYSDNPLINVMTIGVVEQDKVVSAVSKRKGNTVMIVGASTGRDGIRGAEEFENRRPLIQVGDPFAEKLLLEASLEIAKKEYLIGMQDIGAAGIARSTSEMSAKGQSGMVLDLSSVPLREPGMIPYEIMLSESEERILIVIRKGFEEETKSIFRKWDLNCVTIGEVIDTPNLVLYMNGKKVGSIPAWHLVLGGGAPVYERESKKPEYIDKMRSIDFSSLTEPSDYNDSLLKLLSSHDIADKSWIYRQYDHSVMTNTVVLPGGSSAVLRIKGTQKAIATKTDGNGRYTYLNPYKGGAIAVSESARNVVCSGARPIAITYCLNFGNPYDPEIFYQFKNAVLGIGDACRVLETPVIGGDVSFYNESPSGAVYPTPVIGMVGLIDNLAHITTHWFKNDGDFIMMLGTIKGELGGSEYLKEIHGQVAGDAPGIDLDFEKRVQEACLEAIHKGLVHSAIDISDGGLAVAISEACISNPDKPLGASIFISRKLRNDEVFFSESQSVIIVTINEKNLLEMERIAARNVVPCVTIGRVKDNGRLRFNDIIDLPLDEAKSVYETALPKAMGY